MYRRVGTDPPCHLSAGKCLGQVQSAVVPAMRGSVQGERRDKGHSMVLALPLVSSWAGRSNPPRNPAAWHAQTTSLLLDAVRQLSGLPWAAATMYCSVRALMSGPNSRWDSGALTRYGKVASYPQGTVSDL